MLAIDVVFMKEYKMSNKILEPYIDRIIAIRELLDSHHPDTVQEAYDLLFKLWLEFSDNPKFSERMDEIAGEHPKLAQEFTDHLNQSNLAEDEKVILLERINLLFPPHENEDKKKVDTDKLSDYEKLKIINLFLASSSELEDDRRSIEIWVGRENDRIIKKGFYLDLNIWEDFLDAMSPTRLQDEYNKAVTKSDIVICLFATKVGKYTEEEFDVAYSSFKKKGKPKYIYTYFKEVQINTSNLNIDDLVGLQNFKEKLDSLGHFYTRYKSIEDLKGKLDNQLDKILEEIS